MQENKTNIDNKILKRYLEGKGSLKDRIIVTQWLTNSETELEMIERSQEFWGRISPDQDIKEYNGTHILDHIHHKIKIEEAVFSNKTRRKSRFIRYLTRIATILFIPVLVASWLLLSQNKSFRNIKSYSDIHSPYGTRTKFYLPDGSTGWLNGGSSLKFPTQFGRKVRDVTLTGEAYFDVVSNHKKPLIVSTKDIDIKVFGTKFNVMAYTDENITEVTLESGNIEVFKKSDGIAKSIGVLTPNEACAFNSISDSCIIQPVNSTEKLSWLDGKLTFKYEPFEEVVHKINRWYNVNIVIKDDMLNSHLYYGTFKDETLEEVLTLLKYTAPISYRDFTRERNPDGTFEKRKIEIYYKK